MTQREKDLLFISNKKMIYGAIRKYSNKYFLEFMEVEGIALEIFCKACNSYNQEISKFSTYLYLELRNLNNYCKTLNRQRKWLEQIDDIIFNIISYRPADLTMFYDSINTELSEKAGQIVLDILSGKVLLNNKYKYAKVLFNKRNIQKLYNISYKKATDLFGEIKSWWRGYQQAYMYM